MKVIYELENTEIIPDGKSSLLELSLKAEIPIDHSCEGMASCGTCRIIVTEGLENMDPRNQLEDDMAKDRKFKDHERLACQLIPKSSFQFKLPND